MSLHIESHGSGAQLVLIHGWGMHAGFWDNVVPRLAQKFRVHCVDLPGHGASITPFTLSPFPFTLDAIANELSSHFTGQLNVCGWSIGGLVALRWAQISRQQVQRLVLVASTPCFTEQENWPYGVAEETLRQFATELEQDKVAMLRRFIYLMVRGSVNERELLADLRSRLFSHGQPDMNALRGWLEILRDVDFRAELPGISQPALLIAGECDKLTPPEASYFMAQTLPDARLVKIAGAAHVPFLSHPEIFVEQITDFLHG